MADGCAVLEAYSYFRDLSRPIMRTVYFCTLNFSFLRHSILISENDYSVNVFAFLFENGNRFEAVGALALGVVVTVPHR